MILCIKTGRLLEPLAEPDVLFTLLSEQPLQLMVKKSLSMPLVSDEIDLAGNYGCRTVPLPRDLPVTFTLIP